MENLPGSAEPTQYTISKRNEDWEKQEDKVHNFIHKQWHWQDHWGNFFFALSRYGVDIGLAEAAVTVDWVSGSSAIDVAGKTTYQYERK